MAIKLSAAYSKKLGLPGFSSHSFTVSIETELQNLDNVREAIGQLLEYGLWPGAQEPTRFIVVGETLIDKDGKEYLRRLKKRFSLPMEYETVVI